LDQSYVKYLLIKYLFFVSIIKNKKTVKLLQFYELKDTCV